MAYDVARVRGLTPALGDGWIHLDPTPGMPVPDPVVAAVGAELRRARAAPPGPSAASTAAADLEDEARRAVADLVGGHPRGVVLGPSPAVLLDRLADALGSTWMLGDEVVVSRLDDPANVRPWVRNAQRCGAAVHWAEIDIETCELPPWQFDRLLGPATRLVALTAASPQVGTRVNIAAVADRTARTGTLLVADLSAAAPFVPIDVGELGADVVVLDAAAWGGPQVGALVFRSRGLLDRLPSVSLDPTARGPHRLELGPHSTPDLAGLVASVEHLAALDGELLSGPRHERVRSALAELERYHAELVADLLDGLAGTAVTVLGRPRRRVPQLSFTHPLEATDVVVHLARHRIAAGLDPGNRGVLAHLGTGEVGGAVRIGLAHHTTRAEVAALVRCLEALG